MTNADRILAALGRHGPLSDAMLRKLSGVEPHQQVNQICRRLAAQGQIRRSQSVGGPIVNQLAPGPIAGRMADPLSAPSPSRPRPTTPTTTARLPAPSAPVNTDRCLFVLPCSARKASHGTVDLDGPSVLDMLPAELGSRLAKARAALAPAAHLDEARLLPANMRYNGTFYATSGRALEHSITGQGPVVIISGGYGLVLSHEPIGTYDRRFALSDWPRSLLEDCLIAIAARSGVERVLAFCSRTTSYADLIRGVGWRQHGLQAALVAPALGGRRGAQVLVPRAAGEALVAALGGRLESQWVSTDGVDVRVEALS